MALPHALAIGIDEQAFWNMNPRLKQPYEDAHLLRLRQRNYELWLMGQYAMESFEVVYASAWGRKKIRYTPKPYDVYPESNTERRARQKQEYMVRSQRAAFFAWGQAMMSRFGK